MLKFGEGGELHSRSLGSLSSCVPVQGERSVLVLGIRLDHKQAPRDVLGLALEDCDFENRSLPGLVTNTGFVVEIGMDLEGGR